MEKSYYSIGEACEILGVKIHHIRYWETQLPEFKNKTKRGYSRRYTIKEIEFLRKIKELIYEKKYTLEGAVTELKRKKHKKSVEEETLEEIETIVAEPVRIAKNPEIINIETIKATLLEIKEILLKK